MKVKNSIKKDLPKAKTVTKEARQRKEKARKHR
jgi:hypothetical protein